MPSSEILPLMLRSILLLITLALGAAPAAAEPTRVRDVLGREVVLPGPARHIVLGQGRHLPVLGLLHPDPVSLLAGWQDDMRRDTAAYEQFRARFPALADVPRVGGGAVESLSVESIVAARPDLVILSRSADALGGAPGSMTRRLEAAGLPVIVIDFFEHPLTDTVPSLEALGRAIGRAEQADALIAFYRRHLDRIAAGLAGTAQRPRVFVHAHAGGATCCFSPGRGTFDDVVRVAGGRNIAAEVLPGPFGQVSLEYLIGADPEVYVATGGAHLARSGGLVLGPGTDPTDAHGALAALLAQPGLSGLSAVADGRAYGIWHGFNDQPTHIVMIEALAKWLHPDLFRDLDPAATLAEINARFAAVPFRGAYWTGPVAAPAR